MECQCDSPGFCPRYQKVMTDRPWELCSGKCPPERPCPDEQFRLAYIDSLRPERGRNPKSVSSCFFHGDFTGQYEDCPSCTGTVKLKVFACHHPGHAADPTTTSTKCNKCKDYVVEKPQLVVFKFNGLSPGDWLVFTAALESLHIAYPGKYLTSVIGCDGAITENNPHVVPADLLAGAKTVELHYDKFNGIDLEQGINQSGQHPIHFIHAWCDYLSKALDIPLQPRTNRPHIYLSKEEMEWMGRIEEITGKKAPYWVICAGVKHDYGVKAWGHDRWQAIVDRLRDKITFVQVGESHHLHKPLNGVINQIGQTNLRELMRLCWHSEGGIGGVSLLHHIYGAFQKPFVCVASGMESISWELYPTEKALSSHGALPCCRTGGCWKARVVKLHDGSDKDNSLCQYPVLDRPEPVPKCLDMITPDMVVAAILSYYEGGVIGGRQ